MYMRRGGGKGHHRKKGWGKGGGKRETKKKRSSIKIKERNRGGNSGRVRIALFNSSYLVMAGSKEEEQKKGCPAGRGLGGKKDEPKPDEHLNNLRMEFGWGKNSYVHPAPKSEKEKKGKVGRH